MSVLTRSIPFVLLALLMASCQPQGLPADLIGLWKAESLIVTDSVWAVDVAPITLEFSEDNQFTLNWYGSVSETGEAEWSNGWLGIHSQDGGKRKLRITYLDHDSLALAGTLQDQRTVIGMKKSTEE